LVYRSTCNAFFRDLPVFSFVFHSSLLTVKSVNLVVARDGFLERQTITGARSTIVFFIVATSITDVLFEQFLISIAV